MKKEIFELAKDEAFRFVYEQTEFFEGRYAILYKDGSVQFEKMPSASDWNAAGWIKLGCIEGLGLDGILIKIIDPDTDRVLFEEQGLFNLPGLPEPVDRHTTIQIHESTRRLLSSWDETHYIGRKRTYDEIIRALLDSTMEEEPDFLKWNLKPIDKQILSFLRRGKATSREILEEMRKQKVDVTLRTVELRLDNLTAKDLVTRKKEGGRGYHYALNGKIIRK